LQGLPICYSDFTADLWFKPKFRIRKAWRDIADLDPLENDNVWQIQLCNLT